MASRGLGCLNEAMAALRVSAPRSTTYSRILSRSMATEAAVEPPTQPAIRPGSITRSLYPERTVPVTIHSFPSLEPVGLEQWSARHLDLPTRRDLLHHAIVWEGDATRQGTASSKTRWDVAGSHRKIRPQKGSGRARLGTRQSPMLRGGGKTFGPHPRDFATKLNRKVYDRAWRTALSYRWRRGELLVCEDGMDLALPRDFDLVADRHLKDGLREAYLHKYTTGLMHALGLGRASGRTLFVTTDRRDRLFEAMEQVPREGRALDLADVDVKDLLETGRVVMERSVLRDMILQHQSDLCPRGLAEGLTLPGPSLGTKVLGS